MDRASGEKADTEKDGKEKRPDDRTMDRASGDSKQWRN
jgi:hypothetical protein